MAESRRNGRRKRALADITNNSQLLSTISSSSSSKPNNNITETNPTAKLLNPNFVVSLKKSANPPASAASSDCRNNEVFNPSFYPKSHTTRKTKSGNENDKYQISRDAIAIHHQAAVIPQKPAATSTSSAAFIQPANDSAAPSQPSFQILAPVVSIQPPNASALSSQPSIRRLVPAAARLGTSRRHSADKSYKGKEIANAQTEGVSPARWIPTFLRQTNGSGTDKDKNQIAGGSTPIDQTAITIFGSSNQKLMSATVPGTGGFGVSPHSVSTPRQLADRANKGKEIAAAQPEGLSPARWTPSFLRKTTDTSSGKDKNQTVREPTHMNQTLITNPGRSNQKSVSAAVPGTDDFGVSPHSVSTPRQLADRANKGKEIAAAQPLGLSRARWTPTFLRQTTETQSGKEKNQIAGGSTQIDQTVITNPGTDDCGVSPHSVYTRRKSADRTNNVKEIAGAQSLSLSPARRVPILRSKKNDDRDINVHKSCPVPRKKKADISSNKRKVDGDNKARSCILPGKKKQRVMPAKKDDSLPQEFIEQQRAYFKEVDDFELAVEEVSSGDESD